MRRISISHNQLALPFDQIRSVRSYALSTRGAFSYEDREKAFWLIVFGAILSLSAYIYAINAIAHNIAIRENLEREVTEISTKLSALEFEHIEKRNAITMETAQSLGFIEAKSPLYVSRTPSSLTLNSAVR